MAAAITVDRARWLGYRWRGHGLDGRAGRDVLDDLLLLGFQDSRQAGAAQSLLQRTGRGIRGGATGDDAATADDATGDDAAGGGDAAVGDVGTFDSGTFDSGTLDVGAITPTGPLVSLWSVRGAPHAHRVDRLDFVRDALAPQESDDGGAAYIAEVAEVAEALRAVVTGPTTKAEASAETARRVSPSLVGWCARCRAEHVPDALFRAAGRQARLVLGPQEQRATILHPPPDVRQAVIERPRSALLAAYLRVNGPTSRTLFRDWMEGGTRATAELWREPALVRVQVDGHRYDLPEDLLDEVRRAPEALGAVLVPPGDPYLRQVDRTLLVMDGKRRQEVWRALSAPGALLVDGEVAGTWRYRRGDGQVTVTAFHRVAPERRVEAERSARLITRATGDGPPPSVVWE